MALTLSVLAAAAALSAPSASASCPSEGVRIASNRPDAALLVRPQDRRGDAGAQTLAALPPANLQLTVLRSVQGCALSTVVRENVQGDGRFARPR